MQINNHRQFTKSQGVKSQGGIWSSEFNEQKVYNNDAEVSGEHSFGHGLKSQKSL